MAELVDLEAKQQWNAVYVYKKTNAQANAYYIYGDGCTFFFVFENKVSIWEAKHKSFEIYFNLKNELKEYFIRIVNIYI